MLKGIFVVSLALLAPPLSAAQPAAPPAAAQSVTIESYYRIKWGSLGEFERLYERNHAPLLRELQKSGHIVAIKTDKPFTHMAGGVRWDYRVTITYRDSSTAMDMDSAGQKLWADSTARLFPDKTKYEAEESRRFSLVEEHWDVVVG